MRTLLAVCLVACTGGDTDKDETGTTETGRTTPTAETGQTTETGTTDTSTTDTGTTGGNVATADNDAIDNPLFTESFLGSGTPQTFTVADAISAAPGDPEDWVAFTTPALRNTTTNLTFELTCTGTDTIAVQIWDTDGVSPSDLGAGTRTTCATSPSSVSLTTNHDYTARVYYPNGASAPDYTDWSLTVSW